MHMHMGYEMIRWSCSCMHARECAVTT
jgi:hypothetical protein